MEPQELQTESFLTEFGNALVVRDRDAIGELVAPWLEPEELLETLEQQCAEMRHEWELPSDTWPASFRTTSGILGYDDLRRDSELPPGKDIPPQITADNYASWNALELWPDESDLEIEFDSWGDAWMALVMTDEGLRVGSFEVVDAD